MAINIGNTQKTSLEAIGVVTDDTILSGDLSGSLPSPTVTQLQGQALQSSGFAAGLGYRHNGTSFVLTTLLDENSNFGGDVTGTQATNLTVNGINGIGVEAATPSTGQVLQYNGSVWANVDADLGDTMVIASANYTAQDNDHILANTTSAAFTITAPVPSAAGDRFVVYDSHGTFGTNVLTVSPHASGTINGDSGGVDIDVNNAVVEFIYNGAEWRYFVMSVRP